MLVKTERPFSLGFQSDRFTKKEMRQSKSCNGQKKCCPLSFDSTTDILLHAAAMNHRNYLKTIISSWLVAF